MIASALLALLLSPIVAAWSFQCSAFLVHRTSPFRATVGGRQGGGRRGCEPIVISTPADSILGTTRLRFADAAISGGSSSSEPWTTPALHNSAAIRSLALLGALGATSFLTHSPILVPAQAAVALHLFAFALSFGTNAYTTFVLGITMFKNLPRQTFGKLQAKLFPKYFGLSSIVLVLQVCVTCECFLLFSLLLLLLTMLLWLVAKVLMYTGYRCCL
jgi:Domain of unknown function (DUF4149)